MQFMGAREVVEGTLRGLSVRLGATEKELRGGATGFPKRVFRGFPKPAARSQSTYSTLCSKLLPCASSRRDGMLSIHGHARSVLFSETNLRGELDLEIAKLPRWKVELVDTRVEARRLVRSANSSPPGRESKWLRSFQRMNNAVAGLDKIFRARKHSIARIQAAARPHIRRSRQKMRFCFRRTVGLQVKFGKIGMLLRIEQARLV